mmetsp:Transcript_22150/g.68929  ORF Transcript_22150/g.68929 Transcript_22150/m.68929 type:complete len:400 (-) Transcript_22150:604-1803(-)
MPNIPIQDLLPNKAAGRIPSIPVTTPHNCRSTHTRATSSLLNGDQPSAHLAEDMSASIVLLDPPLWRLPSQGSTKAPLPRTAAARGTRLHIVAASSTPPLELGRELERVKNFRCLSEATPAVAPGRVFRTACPASASARDFEAMRGTMNVRALLDLRAEEERESDPEGSLVNEGAATMVYLRGGAQELAVESAAARGSSTGPGLVRHCLSLLDRRRFVRALLKRRGFGFQAQVLLAHVFDADREVDLMVGAINDGGLPELYEVILETSMIEIGQAMRVIMCAAEKGQAALIYCKAGKDRTGLVSMLVLKVMGADDAQVVQDYALSDAHRCLALGGMEKSSRGESLKRLDREQFSAAPASAMEATLVHLEARYGGAVTYLERCGFGADEIGRLRKALAPL